MNLLVLTNPEHVDFVAKTLLKNKVNTLGGVHNVFLDRFGEKIPIIEPLAGWYDIGISFMYTHKVPAEQVKSKPWYNFHPAPLPDYKGRDLCYHAIMNGEKEFGATLHRMDENFDTGEIIAVETFVIQDWWTAQELSEAAISYSKQLFEGYLPKILETPVFSGTPNVGGTYYKKGQIIEEVPVRSDDPFGQFVRAVSYKDFHPRIDIGGVKYKIVREE